MAHNSDDGDKGPASMGVTGDKGLATQFKPGQSGNPKGRPVGSKDRITEKFLDALLKDFKEHGVQAIASMRFNNPADYIKVVAKLVPTEAKVEVIKKRESSELTDRELESIATGSGTGATEQTGSAKASDSVH